MTAPRTLPIYGLTLTPPHGYAMLHLGKRTENRNILPHQMKCGPEGIFRPELHRQRFYVALHGGKSPFKYSGEDREARVADYQHGLYWLHERFPQALEAGDLIIEGIYAVALVDARKIKSGPREKHKGDPWYVGAYGWTLDKFTPLHRPIPCRGGRGLWDIPEDVLPEVRTLWELARKEAV